MGFSLSCKGAAYFTNKPEYECAELFHFCLNEGIIVVALKSKAKIGSPQYRILLGLVFVFDVIISAKSDDTFLPISAPKPFNQPLSEKNNSRISRCIYG